MNVFKSLDRAIDFADQDVPTRITGKAATNFVECAESKGARHLENNTWEYRGMLFYVYPGQQILNS